ncbi:uncharacterized protein [Periplaneta americana]|uniref:uncharacterized protein isoform X1 n=1 Tax=Periplaneta americana TaxID=6978 RepID=UPI0037E7EFBA
MMTKAKRESRSLRNMEEYAVLNVLPTFPVLPSGSNVTEAAPTEINQTTPNTTSPDFNSFYFYEVEQFTVLWILFALIVLGNSAVLVALFLNKSRKSRMNFFIMQLAVADLTVGLISVLTDIVWRITVTWHAGNFACKLIRFLQAVVTYSSTYVLVALSIDRYDAITHPMNFSGSCKEEGEGAGSSGLGAQRFLLHSHHHPVRGETRARQGAVLDRVPGAVAVASVHDAGGSGALRAAGPHHLWMLHRHRAHHLEQEQDSHPAFQVLQQQGGTPAAARRTGQPPSELQGSHPQSQDQDSQDDLRHRLRVHPVLESVLRVRTSTGVRPRAQNADEHRRRHVHPESRPAQLGSQPRYLLPLLDTHVPGPQESASDQLASDRTRALLPRVEIPLQACRLQFYRHRNSNSTFFTKIRFYTQCHVTQTSCPSTDGGDQSGNVCCLTFRKNGGNNKDDIQKEVSESEARCFVLHQGD